MTAAEALRLARACVEVPQRWGQVCFGRRLGEEGALVALRGDADCYCVNGALLAATREIEGGVPGASLALSLSARSHGFETASQFNDAPGRTHDEVLALFDEAIRFAESVAPPR